MKQLVFCLLGVLLMHTGMLQKQVAAYAGVHSAQGTRPAGTTFC